MGIASPESDFDVRGFHLQSKRQYFDFKKHRDNIMTKNNLTYRPGTMNDIDQLQSLRISAYGQFQSVLTPDNWAIFKGNLQDIQKLIDIFKIAKCFVCLDNDKIVGTAYIIPSGNPTDLFKSEWSYIRMVGVNPNYQG